MDDMVTLVLDGSIEDEYAYKKAGESDTEYKTRMKALHERINAQASDEEKRLAAEVLKG